MAYILGLIFSDGAIEDVRKSSRTCYIAITSKDKAFIEEVRDVLSPSHKLYIRLPRINRFSNGKSYQCSTLYTLRIGNKIMYQDLINLGLRPRKSLKMKFPNIPQQYFNFFLRGYFDGDGCVSVYKQRGRMHKTIQVIFTSGTKTFLEKISLTVDKIIKIEGSKVGNYGGAFRLTYKQNKALKLLAFMYSRLNHAIYLDRKYKIYQNYLKNRR